MNINNATKVEFDEIENSSYRAAISTNNEH